MPKRVPLWLQRLKIRASCLIWVPEARIDHSRNPDHESGHGCVSLPRAWRALLTPMRFLARDRPADEGDGDEEAHLAGSYGERPDCRVVIVGGCPGEQLVGDAVPGTTASPRQCSRSTLPARRSSTSGRPQPRQAPFLDDRLTRRPRNAERPAPGQGRPLRRAERPGSLARRQPCLRPGSEPGTPDARDG
jgi:hypothetical protein